MNAWDTFVSEILNKTDTEQRGFILKKLVDSIVKDLILENEGQKKVETLINNFKRRNSK